MLDEDKIRLMTKITIYEKNEEPGELSMSKYYREDYVKLGCLKTLVVTTFCYWLLVAVYILLNLENIMKDINTMDYFKVMSVLMSGYVGAMIVFYLYAFLIYNYKYAKAKPHLVRYNKNLRRLIKLYEKEEVKNQIEDGTVKVYSEIGGFADLNDTEQGGSK
ncbi:MAG: hypothetical protein K6E10_12825 [Eubacterium sp.]|nr:hypothetical protein [Eubacterium sp.]